MNDKEFELRCRSRELELELKMAREYDLERDAVSLAEETFVSPEEFIAKWGKIADLLKKESDK